MTRRREPRPPKPQPDPELPATYESAVAEMVAAAIERIEHMLDGAAGEWLAKALRERLRRGLTDRQKVIDAARDGDILSHEILLAEFHDLLDRNEMPPASLRTYAAQRSKHPRRSRGRVWYDGWRRNYGFCLLIALTAERFGLQVTRSRASTGPCATSITSLALQRRGFKRVSESRLANLWGQLGEITIESIALQRAWPELGPYIRMSGDPARADWNAVVGPYRK